MSFHDTIVLSHGVIGSIAFVVLFPLGAIYLRLSSSPSKIWIHAGIQMLALSTFTVNAGMGLWLAISDGYYNYYHPYIGTVLFATLWVEPLFGLLHHSYFKNYGKRTVPSYVHIWFGRALITLGMINGGLGLMFAENATLGQHIIYGTLAGVVWAVYIGTAVYSEVLRSKGMKEKAGGGGYGTESSSEQGVEDASSHMKVYVEKSEVVETTQA